jgi:hypothetical protein
MAARNAKSVKEASCIDMFQRITQNITNDEYPSPFFKHHSLK